MARCYQLSPDQSRTWDEDGPWPSIALEEDIIDWAYRHNIREPIIVITAQKQIAFALTAQGWRA